MEEPGAMWVQILKGLYFPKCSFLDAKKGGRTSWGWSSILVGRDMLKQEGLWKLGTGENIQLYSDPWVAPKPGFRVEGYFQGDPRQEPQVKDMIGTDGKWDEGRVRQLVTERDAERILHMSIPYT